MNYRMPLIAVLFALLAACSSTPEEPRLSYAETVSQRPMPETEEARLEECKWISSQIKMIDAQANRAQFTQTTKYARLARESADASISLLGVAADHSCARFEIDFDAMSCARCRIRLSQIDSRISGA